MSADPFRFYPQGWVCFLRDLLLSALLGAGIGLALSMGNRAAPLAPQLAFGALLGVWIYLAAAGLLFVFRDRLARAGERGRRVLLAALFFAVGAGAWLLAVRTAPWLTLGWLRPTSPSFGFALAFAGAVGAIVGSLAYAYQSLQVRLEDSIARSKEQEYAARELESARALQRRLLPPPEVAGAGYRVTARNLAARVVAGDFYDVFRLGSDAVGVLAADVAGKGMAASLLVASVKAMVPFIAAERGVAETLRELNQRLVAELGVREFVALCLVRFEPETGRFRLANAGLPDPYLLPAPGTGGSPKALPADGPRLPLGVKAGIDYRSLEGRLAPGEGLLLLTDGLPEALGRNGEPLGYERLAELVAEAAGTADGGRLDALLAALEGEIRPELDDDCTVLLLERPGAAAEPA